MSDRPDPLTIFVSLDDVFSAARRTYIRPAGQADGEDVWLAGIIEDIEKHVRQVVSSRLAALSTPPPSLDAERLALAVVDVEAGYILRPDRTTRTYWRKVVDAYQHPSHHAAAALKGAPDE